MSWPKGLTPWNKGKKTGQHVWNKGTRGLYSQEYRKKIGESHRGNKCYFWKGGVSRGESRKEYYRVKTLERIARLRGAIGSFAVTDWIKLIMVAGPHCSWCNRVFSPKELTIDHIMPLSKGGTNRIDNIQPLCKSCNSKKGVNEINFIGMPKYLKLNYV